ncbi:tRNA lysidine(34) synthetase TilS [Microbulbifer sp. GL-2]|uniref:tRNA lysidine(34) synthetase TilS n=1 Tax=Microbulbifer sp. GL-2 TaxID=2591606 RepID=UPI001E508B6E|nr:tRNA lysidine(34) synthetase TilS [Microbulbifer sp. GL-2]
MTISTSQKRLPGLIQASLQCYPAPGRHWVGFSGGLDSTVLLHVLHKCEIPVQAVYVHHGLSENADRWQDHCRTFSNGLNIPFTALRVAVDKRDGGLEQGARRARYRAFEEVMSPGDQILLGHHGDDQAETFFLRLLRGAGVLGLAGMAEWRSVGSGKSLLRPLLKVGRAELEAWAREHKLSWIDDESNSDEGLDRNFLRHRIMAPLGERWPVRQRVSQAVDNLRESVELLEELALADLNTCDLKRERLGESLCLKVFSGLSMARRKNLLRNWILRQGGMSPESSSLQEALAQVHSAAQDAQLAVQLGGRVVRRYRQRLCLTPVLAPLPPGSDMPLNWDGVSRLALPGGGVLEPEMNWEEGEYRVSYRCGGERAHPVGRSHSQALKKLLQEKALEPWLRDRVPLVYLDGKLVAVAGLFSCKVDDNIPGQPPDWRFFD